MTTARALIKSALRKIQVLGVGSVLSAEDANDALAALNAMLGSWSAEGNMVFADQQEVFNLVAGQNIYTIGSGQNFNTSLPKEITDAYVTDSGGDYALERRGQGDWAAIYDKKLEGIPQIYHYDQNFPVGRIYLWPTPSQNFPITMFNRKAITGFPTLDTVFEMPGEYERAIIYNLAIDLAPEYEKEPTATVNRIARQSKAVIEAQNAQGQQNMLRVDDALLSNGCFDIYTGTHK